MQEIRPAPPLVLSMALVMTLAGCATWTPESRDGAPIAAQETLLRVLDATATVHRDDRGIPYIHAGSLDDALRIQGFETARDRLYQMELERHVATGRLAELIGERGLPSDTLIRIVGIGRLGQALADRLESVERLYYDAYREGLNAYIETMRHEHPAALSAMGMRAQPWSLADVMALQLFRTWSSSTNWRQELLTQQLVDHLGRERAHEISQLSVNPDAEPDPRAWKSGRYAGASSDTNTAIASEWLRILERSDAIGSNAWVVGSGRSPGGAPILASDPHVDARRLPGFWHPVALITPELRAIGGGTPGTPGIGIGRTEHIAFGATNGYADVVDLYLERPDPGRPDHYLEGETSLPFEIREETIGVREPDAPGGRREVALRIRSTRRGPILSDHGLGTAGDALLSLRWSVAEHSASRLGSRELLLARSVPEAQAAIFEMITPLTQIVADREGSITLLASGLVPARVRGDGSAPLRVLDESDSWAGFIPGEEMPSLIDPDRGWVGSANHRVVPEDYPHPYSTHFSHSWRYRRLRDLLDEPGSVSVDDHWRILLDVRNEMAVRIAPIMASAIQADPENAELAVILEAWNREDAIEEAGAALFQSIYRHFAWLVFEDELGTDLTGQLLEDPYYWNERLALMVEDDSSSFFDDVLTDPVETRDDLFREAARRAHAELSARLGPDPARWTWGRLHRTTFSSPIETGPLAADCRAGGTFPSRGSGETLNRAAFYYSAPYETRFLSSMRFVADLSDAEKVTAMIPGGTSGRCGSPHLEDRLEPWLRGEMSHWWYSDEAIERHAVSRTVYLPE